jgi:hypothetical protein
MSAMTIAVAVIHDTLPADILPAVAAAKAESVMSDLYLCPVANIAEDG